MKKLLTSLTAFTIALNMAACTSSDNDDGDSSPNKDISSADTSSGDTSESSNDSDDASSDGDSDGKDDKGASVIQVSEGEQVIWETDDIILTLTGIEDDGLWGTEISVAAESISDREIRISEEAIIVNDLMVDGFFYLAVPVGDTVSDTIEIYQSDLNAAGIEHIGKIELYLYTSDPGTFSTIDNSECITLQLSDHYDTVAASDIEGTVLLDQNGVMIIGQFIDEESLWGDKSFRLYIENNTDKNISVYGDNITINGYMSGWYMHEEVYAGKKTFSEITLFGDDLEENGITSIETIEVRLEVTDDDNNNTVASTNKATINVS